MNNRTVLDAADLYMLLQREFRRRQAPECSGCFVQLPFRVDREDDEAPNWEIALPPACAYKCRTLAEELVGEFQMLYELSAERRHN